MRYPVICESDAREGSFLQAPGVALGSKGGLLEKIRGC